MRSYLFLQGVCSPFFLRLAEKLKAEGHGVHKVHFNVGDAVYWSGGDSRYFRGHLSDLKQFLHDIYRKFGVTDQIVFGDRRPIHIAARELGRHCGIRTHIFEEGYFRPYWVTLERDGVNGHSRLPRDANWYREVGKELPDYGDGEPFQSSFRDRALHDVVYHAAGFWNPLVCRRYRTHAPINAASEYAGYVRRLPLQKLRKTRDEQIVAQLAANAQPFFFLPLQLGSDAQILDHSRHPDMVQVIELVMSSFAKHASTESKLVIKNHPLDTGLVDYPEIIRRLAESLELIGRIDYIESGDLNLLLRQARGTITVNSTVGALALGLGCPTIALGAPIYHLAGLTYQGRLDDFWNAPTAPDMTLFRCFRNTVIHATQINGGFYSREGIEMAVNNSRNVLVAEKSPLESLL